jgi:hypothetical protein
MHSGPSTGPRTPEGLERGRELMLRLVPLALTLL